jgi:ElaB/YqjD/DUF883 family membrane-anchored ribosome-binding protein
MNTENKPNTNTNGDNTMHRNLSDDVLQSAEEAVKATHDKADKLLNAAQDGVHHLRTETSPAIQDLATRAQDLASRSIDYCAHASDRARRQLHEVSEATTRYVAQQPAKSMAIAVASGAAIGALALWLSRRPYGR